jgi:hypothetical protein
MSFTLAEAPARADEPPAQEAPAQPATVLPSNLQLLGLLGDRVTRFESVEMLWAIAVWGPRTGANDGWFHPGKSRYTPQWLAGRYDANHDYKVTPDEFKGPRAMFDRLDRDHSGVLTIDDFDWSEQSAYLRQAGQVGRSFQLVDTNSNGRISKQEWMALFENAAKDKDHLTPEDLRMALNPPPKPAPAQPPTDAPTRLTLLAGFFKGELGLPLEGPAIDELAPAFILKTQDGKRTISLAESRGKSPVVLIFGSFT